MCQLFVQEVFAKCGLSGELADCWASLLVETSLLGIDSHGIRMLDRYVSHIQGGGIATVFDPVTLKDHLATAVVNARERGASGRI